VFESGIEANLRFVEFTAGDIRWSDPVTHSTENIGKIRLHASSSSWKRDTVTTLDHHWQNI